MLGLAVIPATLQLIGFIMMPETPRWLAAKVKSVIHLAGMIFYIMYALIETVYSMLFNYY